VEAKTSGRPGRHDVGVSRIGILTGGCDVPGLNSIINSDFYRGWVIGWETIGIRHGW
jgi:6-phosphofructokinase